jgi:hypothetical protein
MSLGIRSPQPFVTASIPRESQSRKKEIAVAQRMHSERRKSMKPGKCKVWKLEKGHIGPKVTPTVIEGYQPPVAFESDV